MKLDNFCSVEIGQFHVSVKSTLQDGNGWDQLLPHPSLSHDSIQPSINRSIVLGILNECTQPKTNGKFSMKTLTDYISICTKFFQRKKICIKLFLDRTQPAGQPDPLPTSTVWFISVSILLFSPNFSSYFD